MRRDKGRQMYIRLFKVLITTRFYGWGKNKRAIFIAGIGWVSPLRADDFLRLKNPLERPLHRYFFFRQLVHYQWNAVQTLCASSFNLRSTLHPARSIVDIKLWSESVSDLKKVYLSWWSLKTSNKAQSQPLSLAVSPLSSSGTSAGSYAKP